MKGCLDLFTADAFKERLCAAHWNASTPLNSQPYAGRRLSYVRRHPKQWELPSAWDAMGWIKSSAFDPATDLR